LEEEPGQPRRVQVVVLEWMAQSSRYQPRVETVCRVLDQDGTVGKLLKSGGYLAQGGGSAQHGAVDSMHSSSVRIDVVGSVHQALQGDPGPGRAVVVPELKPNCA
jgi:hypothetical protein